MVPKPRNEECVFCRLAEANGAVLVEVRTGRALKCKDPDACDKRCEPYKEEVKRR